jgi:hypothetical protein
MTTAEAFLWLREHRPCTVSFGVAAVHVRVGNGHPSATAATLEEAVEACALKACLQVGVCPSISGPAPYEELYAAWSSLPVPATDETIEVVAARVEPARPETWRDREPLL